MTSDLDNLYILFETAQGTADIDMRRFDISAYAQFAIDFLNK